MLAQLSFSSAEPSLGIHEPRFEWLPALPSGSGVKFRAALEALACLVTLGVHAHEKAGQKVTRITVSGGIARSELMCEILASMLDKPISTLESFEGPALGAATAAFASLELHMRKQAGIKEPFTIADAMAKMIRFKRVVQPNKNWVEAYQKLLTQFKLKIGM